MCKELTNYYDVSLNDFIRGVPCLQILPLSESGKLSKIMAKKRFSNKKKIIIKTLSCVLDGMKSLWTPTASFMSKSSHEATALRLRIRYSFSKSVLTVWCCEIRFSDVPSTSKPRKRPLVKHTQISSRHYCQGISVSMSLYSAVM